MRAVISDFRFESRWVTEARQHINIRKATSRSIHAIPTESLDRCYDWGVAVAAGSTCDTHVLEM